MSIKNNVDLVPWRHYQGEEFIQGYRQYSDGSKASIHFLHGNGFAASTYLSFLQQLKGYDVILQNAPGHGGSTAGKAFIGWNRTASRLVESLRSLSRQPSGHELIGVGHSFGGCITVLMNDQEQNLFDRMVLLDPALFPPRLIWMMRGAKLTGLKSQIPLARQARRRRTQWESLAQVKNSFYERGTFKGWQADCLDDYIASSLQRDHKGHYQLSCPTWMEAAIFSSYPKGLWRAIANISVPTYILQGKDTFDYFKEAYQLAAKMNSNIQIIEVEGGHCFMQQHPWATAQTITEILDPSCDV